MKTFIIGLLSIILVALVYAILDNPHKFSNEECKGCHTSMPQPGQKSPLPMRGKIKTLCSRCHFKLVKKYSHPDDIVPVNVRIPADMPLSVDKKITCATCHDIHTSLDWSKSIHLLRRPATGVEFCSECHGEGLGKMSHGRTIGFAHDAGSKYIHTRSGSLDRLSIQCISCHSNMSSAVGTGFWRHSRELSQGITEHPIGVNYEETRARHPDGFNLRSSLAPVKLFNGNVGCGSCHDPYSTRIAKLVMGNEGSKLCLKCHNL